MDKALQHLDRHAQRQSTGQCARYVRQALQAGGLNLKPPYPASAKYYGRYLEDYGFSPVAPKPPANYSAQRGDIIVIQPYSIAQPHGHIAIFNGARWVSDFIQRSGDIWPGPGYRQHKPDYEIYRR